MTQQDISAGLIELTKLVITGIIGGIDGGWISFRFFIAQKRYETKHEDNIGKRDALREMILALSMVRSGILSNWDLQREEIENLYNQIAHWKILFLNDQQMLDVIKQISSLIGMPEEAFHEERPGRIIRSLEEVIKEKIREIEKILT